MEKRAAINYLFLGMALLLASCQESSPVPDFVSIPAGDYTLGADDHFANPAHVARLDSFSLGRYEISNTQFSAFVKSTGYVTTAEQLQNALVFREGVGEFKWVEDPSANWRFPQGKEFGGIEEKMDHPVTCISYLDAEAYCKWAQVRLPTLDEWEVASRCGTSSRYYWGQEDSLISQHANIWKGKNHLKASPSEVFAHTAPIGSYEPNPWGLHDMYGNVFEFCTGLPAPLDSIQGIVSARGGSWWCSQNTCNYFNSIDIGKVRKEASFSNHGFRVVKEAS